MKYDDYPIPTEKLINILNTQYSEQMSVKKQSVVELGSQEQKNKLNELFMYINAERNYLSSFLNDDNIYNVIDSQLKILSDMGVKGTIKSCQKTNTAFWEYLKCEGEILKILLFLIFMDNLNYSKSCLNQILIQQIDVYNYVVNLKN